MQSPAATIAYAPDGLLVDCNAMAAELFGLPREDAIGAYNVLENPQNVEIGVVADFARALQGEVVRRPSVLFRPPELGAHRGRPPFWLQATLGPLRDRQGAVIGVIEIDVDVTQVRLEVATPLIPIADDVLVMPLIGILDNMRMVEVIDTLLTGVAAAQEARRVLLDVTGVAEVDESVTSGLGRAARAMLLLGVELHLTGVQSQVARALSELGFDQKQVRTHASLQEAVAELVVRPRQL